ncbi:MAG: DNA methyltransferase [bacterium]
MAQNLYCFILGRNPTLGAAEVHKILEKEIAEVVWISPRVMTVRLNKKLAVNKDLMENLYGTTKIVEIIDVRNFEKSENIKTIIQEINLENYLAIASKKTIFGMSVYNLDAEETSFERIFHQLNPLAVTVKKILKEKNIKSGFVKKEGTETSSGSIRKNNLLQNGGDIVIITRKKEVLLGKTVAIQDFEEYEWRNYHRPARNLKSGIMPIKLARLMISLASANKTGAVLDPFCGSGTVLQELILLGFKKIIGFDINKEAINDSQKNIDWLLSQYPQIDPKQISLKISLADARELDKLLPHNSIDAIISEPYLGPIYEKPPKKQELAKIIKELSELYIDFFKKAALVLKTNGKIVIVFPCFPAGENIIFLEILEEIKKAGFVIEPPLPSDFLRFPAIQVSKRNSVLFIKEKQIIIREILLFKKNAEN